MQALETIEPAVISLEKKQRKTTAWHIHLRGMVQGVGFRPFVYRLAREKGLNGAVSNGIDGVHIWLETNREEAHSFLNQILSKPPALARITGHNLAQGSNEHFADFSIIEKQVEATPNLWITPDLALCADCRKELHDPKNRRYKYPFITCTECGPRYSIMRQLPFERRLTTMAPFNLCPNCEVEFNNPADRRFFAQTTSCPDCGVTMELCDANGQPLDVHQHQIIQYAEGLLKRGYIIAVKGIGGFLLMADATNAAAIQLLRDRKNRPSKPFAILYPDLANLIKDADLNEMQKEALQSKGAPIVLVTITDRLRQKIAIEKLAPGLDKIGIMLPYAPLLEILALETNIPLVATSGNVSGAPICFSNKDALEGLAGIADYFLLNNRDIVAPQDDSVLSFSDEYQIRILLRRSRGWAPAFPFYQANSVETILATGALLKSSFTLSHQQQVYISQYLGNTDSYEAQLAYRHTLAHLQSFLQAKPGVIVTDSHPQYFSHLLAKELAAAKDTPLVTVQHHKAHFAALLGERNLIKSQEPVLGVIWDGNGWGEDGRSWGGEFFLYKQGVITRPYHVDYFPYLLGDKMAREPRLSALSLFNGNHSAQKVSQHFFTPQEWDLYGRMIGNFDGIYTSSIGRMFDAVACLLTGIGKQSYEGEAAMQLESMARQWRKLNGTQTCKEYAWDISNSANISFEVLFREILDDYVHGRPHGEIAAGFHDALAGLIITVARALEVKHIAFSGGVWQNSLLVDMVTEMAASEFRLYFHQHLSPNDENISFGQLVWHDNNLE